MGELIGRGHSSVLRSTPIPLKSKPLVSQSVIVCGEHLKGLVKLTDVITVGLPPKGTASLIRRENTTTIQEMGSEEINPVSTLIFTPSLQNSEFHVCGLRPYSVLLQQPQLTNAGIWEVL